MGSLTLVRHGQARLFTEDYDRLSEAGEKQARLLGDYWVQANVAFDRAIAGPRKRQRDTASIVAAVYREAGRPFPEIESTPHFDEMHAEELLRTRLPSLAAEHPHLARMVGELGDSAGTVDAFKKFQRVFEAVMLMWVRGEIASGEVEDFAAFSARVTEGIDGFRAGDARGARIVAFTSAGTIAAAMRTALDLSAEKVLDLAGVVKNASVTELAFSRTRLTPTLFNAVPHLPPDLWTHR